MTPVETRVTDLFFSHDRQPQGYRKCKHSDDGGKKGSVLTDQEEEHEQSEFTERGFECHAQDLESFGVTGKFEDTEDSDQSNDSQDGQ